jgi:hypothetical protein
MPTSVQIATVAGVLVWPLAAGLGLVMWTKARAAAHARKVAAMELKLRGMFREVEERPVPPHLAMVVDALEEGDALIAPAAAKDAPVVARP